MHSASQETYFRPREAAEYLRSSESTLAKKRLNGDGPSFVRIGRAIRYRRSDLDAWMSASIRTSTSETAVTTAANRLSDAARGAP
jgi:excisionase family DNA binding protein